ncbi:iron donor protein CyaY [Ideonella sp. A 288]|uniref:iron donor protein CyaY n=1 Tax=Ideonella sp. A 288 TaxID=1962181 RepID=UPI001F3D8950|nr:iron donor protein CyaY [Ideonella sp. A 288]
MSDAQYDALSREVLRAIETTVDRWLDEDVIDIDTHRTGGLLELSFPDGSKLIVNTQPPLHEIWLAAKSGGRHFRHEAGRWIDTRDGSEFFAVLSAAATEQGRQALSFTPPSAG